MTEYRKKSLKEIKELLEFMLHYDYSEWTDSDLMQMKHILFYHFRQVMKEED